MEDGRRLHLICAQAERDEVEAVDATDLEAAHEVSLWSFWTGREVGYGLAPDRRGKRDPGDGLPRELLPTYRGQLAVATLASALIAQPEFHTHFADVADGADPLEVVARPPYSRRRSRREIVARFVQAAADEPDYPDQAMTSLAHAPAVTVGAKDASKRLPYYFDESFGEAISQGALAIAWRGAGRCILCGKPYIGEREVQRKAVRRAGKHAEMRFETVKLPRLHCGCKRVPASLEDDVDLTFKTVKAALRPVGQPTGSSSLPPQVVPPQRPPNGGSWTPETREAWLRHNRSRAV